MNKEFNTSVILTSLLGFVFSLILINSGFIWYQNQNLVVLHTYTPMSNKKLNSDKDHYYPHQLEAKALLVNKALPHQEKGISSALQSEHLSMKEFMELATIKESSNLDGNQEPYLVIAGAYTDETFVISKQAQLQQLGLPAEIIQFGESRYKKLCVGRYQSKSDAEVLANSLESDHNISAYVYSK